MLYAMLCNSITNQPTLREVERREAEELRRQQLELQRQQEREIEEERTRRSATSKTTTITTTTKYNGGITTSPDVDADDGNDNVSSRGGSRSGPIALVSATICIEIKYISLYHYNRFTDLLTFVLLTD